MGRKYKNSPIIEALCEFRFEAGTPWDLTIPGLLYERIRQTFPGKRPAKHFEVTLAPTPGQVKHQLVATDRMQFLREDEKALLQVDRDLLVVNHLKPYPTWTEFLPLIRQAFKAYGDVANPKGLRRIGLRYINRIEIPGPRVELEDYLNFRPFVGAGLPQDFASFIVGIEIPYDNSRDRLRLQATTAAAQPPGAVAIMLDLDYFLAQPGQASLETVFEWLDAAHENSPFFLWVDSFDPHEPWDPPTKYADEYCPDYDGLDFIVPGAMHQDPGATEAEIERTKALYLGEVTFVDKQVGRLFDKLEELNLWDETIVVVLSDHGTEIMDHGGFGKGGGNMRTYNAGFLWYMWHPDGPHGVVSDGLVQSHDLMPTLLNQLDVPHSCEGLDVWDLATGATDSVHDHIVNGWALHSIGSAQAAASVMDGEWLYSCGVGGAEVEEM